MLRLGVKITTNKNIMKFFTIKKIAVASTLLAGSLASVTANADYTFQLTWQDSLNNQMTGSLTVNTLTIPLTDSTSTNYAFGSVTSAPTWVTGASVTYGGVTYNDISGLTRIIARTSGVTLDTTTTNFKSSFTDLNLFTLPQGTQLSCSSSNNTPNGQSPFVLRTCSGATALDWTLMSLLYGSSGSSISVSDTQNSLRNTSSALRGVYDIASM